MIYNGVGYISSAMEDYDKASDCYHKALTIFLSLEEIDYVGETLYNISNHYVVLICFHHKICISKTFHNINSLIEMHQTLLKFL